MNFSFGSITESDFCIDIRDNNAGIRTSMKNGQITMVETKGLEVEVWIVSGDVLPFVCKNESEAEQLHDFFITVM